MKKYIPLFVFLALVVSVPNIGFAGGSGGGSTGMGVTNLVVTNISAVKTSATANNIYSDGWKWNFDLFVPNGETKLQMKFADWTNGSLSIPAGGNMRFYSSQSTNASTTDSAINIDSSNTYGGELTLDPSKGQQVQVSVEVKVPVGTTGGSYSTSYGVQTTGTTTSELPALNLRLSDNSRATSTFVYGSDATKRDIFEIKAKENSVVWVNDLSFKFNVKDGYNPKAVFGTVWGGMDGEVGYDDMGEWINDDTVVFHNLNIRLSQTSRSFTLMSSSRSTSTPITASVTMKGSEIKAEDNLGLSLDVSGVEDVVSNEITYIYIPVITSIESRLSSDTPATSTVIMADQTPLAVFGFISTTTASYNNGYTIKNLNFIINNKDGLDPSTLLNDAQLFSCSENVMIASSTIGAGGLVSFNNLDFTISGKGDSNAPSIWNDLCLKTSPKTGVETFTVSATLDTSTIEAFDINNQKLNVLNSNDLTGNEITFIPGPRPIIEISKNSNNSNSITIITDQGSNGDEADMVSVLVFNLKAKNSNARVTNITASTSLSIGDLTNAYLFDGSTLLDSVQISNGVASFVGLDLDLINDQTKTLRLAVDIRNASSTPGSFNASVSANGITTPSGLGTTIVGSATSNVLTVQTSPVYTLVGTPTLTKTAIGNTASSSYLASFHFTISTQGADVQIASTDVFVIGIYVNNVQVATASGVYEKPTSGVTGSGPYTIADGTTATFRVETSFTAPVGVYTSGIVNARLESATTNVGTVTYISDTYRTGSQVI